MSRLTIDGVANYAYAAGFRGNKLEIAVAVSCAENANHDTAELGDIALEDATWGPSVGLWQIRSLKAQTGRGTDRDVTILTNPALNARSAYNISGSGSNWKPWTTYQNGAYKAFLPDAAAAATRVASETGTPAPTLTPVFLRSDMDPALNIKIGGQQATSAIGYAFAGGQVSYTTQEASQLTLVFDDNDYLLLERFNLAAGPNGTPVEFGGLRWRVQTLTTQPGPKGPQTVFVCQPAGVMRMRGFTPSTLSQISPTEYMAQNIGGVLGFRGEQTADQSSVGPQQVPDPVTGQTRLENLWELGQRLAQERKMVAYESGGVYFFGTPPFLAGAAKLWQLSVNGAVRAGKGDVVDCFGWPTIAAAVLDPTGHNYDRRTLSAQIPRSVGEKLRGGDELWVSGVPALDGIVSLTLTSVQWDLKDAFSPVTIQAVDRSIFQSVYASKADETASSLLEFNDVTLDANGNRVDVSPTPSGKTKSALDFVTLCLRQVGDRYVFGAPRTIGKDPNEFDCSSLVYWAAGQVGVTVGTWSGAQYSQCARAHKLISVDSAKHIRGALLFRGPGGADHVAISLGDGKHTVEARGRAYGVVQAPITGREWDGAGLIPGMRYQ